jgi:DNA helicase-2/ATP-dependent DNA helicase PcrA
LILNLAKILPCRIVGDPLQGIYDFGKNQIVNWNNDVFQHFTQLPALTIPYRWKRTNMELGERLKELREQLLSKQQIEFNSTIDDSYGNIIKFLYDNSNETSVFVISNPNPGSRYYPHTLAKSMNNIYQTIEPLTSNDLCNYAKKIELTNGDDRLKNVINFSKTCLTKISNSCQKVLSENKHLDDVEIKLKDHFHNIKNNNKLNYVYDLFSFFEIAFIPTYKRKQLWREMKEGLHEVVFGHIDSLEDAVWHIRNQFRFNKKRIPERCISRTVLLKGLECNHVIIIRPELFDMKNLYVALTRASSKVTIISKCKTWSNY